MSNAKADPMTDRSFGRRIWGPSAETMATLRGRLLLLAGLALLALVVNNVATNPRFQWGVVAQYLFDPVVLLGFATTLWLTAAVMAIGLVLGIVLALMSLSQSRGLRTTSAFYLWFFRGTPVLVQLIFW